MTEQINSKLDDLQREKKPENMNSAYEKLRSDAPNEAVQIAKEAGSIIQNVDEPNETMAQACQTIATTDRLVWAYDVCERLAEDDAWYAQKLEEELGDSEQVQREKTKMLKQACNALFCSSKSSYNDEIGRAQVCFADIGGVQQIEEERDNKTAPSAQSGQQFFFRSIKIAFFAVLVGIFGTLFYIFIVQYLWPKVIIPLYEWIKEFFSRYKRSRQSKALDAVVDKNLS